MQSRAERVLTDLQLKLVAFATSKSWARTCKRGHPLSPETCVGLTPYRHWAQHGMAKQGLAVAGCA